MKTEKAPNTNAPVNRLRQRFIGASAAAATFVLIAFACGSVLHSSTMPSTSTLLAAAEPRPAAVSPATTLRTPLTWQRTRQIGDDPLIALTELNIERHNHAAAQLADGRLLVVGGENRSGSVAQAEVFDPLTRRFSLSGSLNTARVDHTATPLVDGRVIVTGGRAGKVLDSTEIFEPAAGSFSPGPALHRARAGHTATLLEDGRVLIVGGDKEGSAEILDPTTGEFELLEGRLSAPRSFHSAVVLRSGKVLIAGGVDADGAYAKWAELFDPDTEQFSRTRGQMKGERRRPTLRLLFDGKVQVIGGDKERSMEMYNQEGEYFTAYARLLQGSTVVAEVMRTQTRAALIQDAEWGPALRLDSLDALSLLLDRRDHSISDDPEMGQAVVAGGTSSSGEVLSSAIVLASSGATVTTDKTDYAPGETVIITGAGWQAGETVDLRIQRSNGAPDTLLTAVADSNGNISNSEFVIQDADLGVVFTLTATGRSSGRTAQTTFTDGNIRVRTNAAGITFDLSFERYSQTGCTGTIDESGREVDVGNTAGTQFNLGVGNTQSIRLTAEPFSNQCGRFINWTAVDTNGSEVAPPLPSTSLTICVPGFQEGGSRLYIANYDACLPPGCDIVGSNSTCAGSTGLTYTGPGGPGLSYTWSISGNGTIVGSTSGQSVSVDAGAAGSFTLTLTVTNSATGCCKTCTKRVTVNPNPACEVTGPDHVCAGSTGNTFSGPAGSGLTYLWSISGNGSIVGSTTGQSVSVTAGSAGSFDLSLTVTNSTTGCSSTCSKNVRVNALPTATVSGDATICPGGSTTISAALTGTRPWAVTWSDGFTQTDILSSPATRTVSPASTTTYTVTAISDANCTGTSSGSATVTVGDTQPPTVTCPPGSTVPVEPHMCELLALDLTGAVTASDNCSPQGSLIVTQNPPPGRPLPPGTHPIEITVTDEAGNSAMCTTSITVVDETPPVVTAGSIAACYRSVAEAEAAAIAATTATDNCGGDITKTASTSGDCSATITVTATDAFGNAAWVSYSTRIDGTPPVFIDPPQDVIVDCDAVLPPLGPIPVTDNCDQSPSVDFSEARIDGNCPDNYSIRREWTATDSCGNPARWEQTITVRDSTRPVLNGVPADETVECNAIPPEARVTATDNCDPNPAVTFEELRERIICDNSFTLRRVWTATDRCGNSSTATQLIVVQDTTEPALVNPPPDETVECDAVPPAPTLTATDNCDPAPRVAFDERRIDGSCPNSYTLTRTWTATDRCGNTSTHTQTVTVRDTTPPVLTGCPADLTIQCFADLPFRAAVTAQDNCDGSLTVDFNETQSDSGSSCNNIITRTWTAVDRCGNRQSCTQVITVNDTTPPAVSCPAPLPAVCADENGMAPIPIVLPVAAVDNCTPAAALVAWQVPPASTQVGVGTHTITVNVRDVCGNVGSCAVSFTVHPRPSCDLSGPATVASGQSAGYTLTTDAPSQGTGSFSTSWSATGGTINSQGNTGISWTAPAVTHSTTVTISVTVTNSFGCQSTCSTTVTVLPVTLTGFVRDTSCNPLPNGFDMVFNNGSCSTAGGGPLKLAATNPGGFMYNLKVTNNGTSAAGPLAVTINLGDNAATSSVVDGAAIQPTAGFNPPLDAGSMIGQPAFSLKGSVPVHVYTGDPCPVLTGQDITTCSMVSILRQDNSTHQLSSGNGSTCPSMNPLSTGDTAARSVMVTVPSVPAGGMVVIQVHLDYRLKGTSCWTSTPDSRTMFRQSYQFISDVSIGGSPVPDVITGFTGTGKRVTAIGGYAIKSTGAPAANLTASVNTTPTASTDVSNLVGFYFIPVPPSPSGYSVTLTTAASGAPTQNTGPIAQDQYVEVNFLNLNPADPAVDVGVADEKGNGVSGVTVELIQTVSGRLMATKLTNSGGYCGFRFAQPGRYTIRISPPSGYVADNPAQSVQLAQFQETAVAFRVRRQ